MGGENEHRSSHSLASLEEPNPPNSQSDSTPKFTEIVQKSPPKPKPFQLGQGNPRRHPRTTTSRRTPNTPDQMIST